MKLIFHESGCGKDFEDDCDWPSNWPHDIVDETGFLDYGEPFVKFKAYDLTID